jgi:hypothetical protein
MGWDIFFGLKHWKWKRAALGLLDTMKKQPFAEVSLLFLRVFHPIKRGIIRYLYPVLLRMILCNTGFQLKNRARCKEQFVLCYLEFVLDN